MIGASAAFYAGFGLFLALLAALTGFVIAFVRKLGRSGRKPPRP